MIRYLLAVAVLSWGLALPAASRAEHKCARCGEAPACCKVCRVVCEYKDVKKTKWTCEPHDICLPGPAKYCGHAGPCGCPVPVPTPGRIITRRHLIRVEYTCRVPVYRLVVEYLCPECKSSCHSDPAPAPEKSAAAAAPVRPASYASQRFSSSAKKTEPAR